MPENGNGTRRNGSDRISATTRTVVVGILLAVCGFAFAAWAFVVDNAATLVVSEIRASRIAIDKHVEKGAHDVADNRLTNNAKAITNLGITQNRQEQRIDALELKIARMRGSDE